MDINLTLKLLDISLKILSSYNVWRTVNYFYEFEEGSLPYTLQGYSPSENGVLHDNTMSAGE